MTDPHQNALGVLDQLPRTRLGHTPTPLEPLPRLTEALAGARLWVKRDDCTGLAFGGNKVRQLEYYLGEAMARNADTILITGAVQSNFVRLAAAASAQLGLQCHVQLEERVPDVDHAYHVSGNVLLDRLLGAAVYHYPDGEDEAGADRRMSELGEQLRAEGNTPYQIPLAPGHAPLGALGYVRAAEELLEQCRSQNLDMDEVVIPSGSGHTHGGTLYGLRAHGFTGRVTGVCVRRTAEAQKPRIIERCNEIGELLKAASPVSPEDVVLDDRFLAPGYGQLNEATIDALKTAAETEGLLVDPVYTAKAMAGFMARAKQLDTDKNLVFVHTGGLPALFAYERQLNPLLGAD